MTLPVACVAGWPIAHSRSPVIHRYWLDELGIAGDYVKHAVEPGAFPAFLGELRAGRFVGANVTVPHKQAAFAGVDRRDAAAEATGAVNTIWREGDVLHGANTDPVGFLAALDEGAPGWRDAADDVVVVGAGGAARAVAWALATRGCRVAVVNRTIGRAEKLAAEIGGAVTPVAWNLAGDALDGAGLLVNTTTLGMAGQGPSPDLPLERLGADAVVDDIVYTPLVTGLLAGAAARGLRTVDGLGMLLHQAALGFERWFGAKPAVSPGLRAAVLADIGRD